MSDFFSGFWSWYVAAISLLSILACAALLLSQNKARPPKNAKGEKSEEAELHGNVWDGDLREYNNPLPRWWMWLFVITIVFGLVYLLLYPGLGSYAGTLGWSSRTEYEGEIRQADKEVGPLFAKYQQIDIAALSQDPQANAMGQRLFLSYCAQCHGSDAGGARGFPNLRDKDWLYGGDPATIEATILNGRNGVMPPMAAVVGEDAVVPLVHYVRSLSGLPHDPRQAAIGQPKFAVCAACHGADGKGNQQIGAPNLSDETWLYGSAEETIAEGIRNGRNNQMPAQKERLGEAKVHVLAAYVYSLGGGTPSPAARR